MQTHKITLLGDICAGKSSILDRLIDNAFHESNSPTIGVSFATKEFPKENMKLQFWDTCGTEKYADVMKLYYRNVSACLVVFDTTDPEGVNNCVKWIRRFKDECEKKEAVVYLVGNKTDMENKTNTYDVFNVCQEFDARYFKVSAKDGMGIDNLFSDVIHTLRNIEAQKSTGLLNIEKPSKKKREKCECTLS